MSKNMVENILELKITKQILRASFACILISCANLSYALQEDNQEPLELHANTADISQKSHVGTYVGEVEFDQGTTHIRAKKAITKTNDKNQLTEAIIMGDSQNQAHYWALISKDKQELHAYADTIYYFPNTHTIKLEGNAKIEQGNNSFSAPVITYNTIDQHVTSSGKGERRTIIIFHPKVKK
jgi:lipopolysaccharide export system protein LptA